MSDVQCITKQGVRSTVVNKAGHLTLNDGVFVYTYQVTPAKWLPKTVRHMPPFYSLGLLSQQ